MIFLEQEKLLVNAHLLCSIGLYGISSKKELTLLYQQSLDSCDVTFLKTYGNGTENRE